MKIFGENAGTDRTGQALFRVSRVELTPDEKKELQEKELVLKFRLEKVVGGEPVFSAKKVSAWWCWPPAGYIN